LVSRVRFGNICKSDGRKSSVAYRAESMEKNIVDFGLRIWDYDFYDFYDFYDSNDFNGFNALNDLNNGQLTTDNGQ
jgi:hypothetical protein